MSHTLFEYDAVEQALDAMSAAIITAAAEADIYLVGIQRGGANVADAIEQRLAQADFHIFRGNLDISFYRDDLDTIGPNPEIHPSELPFDISGKDIWLIDDVLFTGRTIRAAMDELFDYGRPASIRLAVLVDRGGRQLPIRADYTGLAHRAAPDCTVELVTGERWHIEQRQVK